MGQPRKYTVSTDAIDLAPDTAGRQLQMRRVVIEPGAEIGMHSHATRPGMSYVLEGTLTEYDDAGHGLTRGAGDVMLESRNVTHSARNDGSCDAVLLSVHVIRKR